jgi:hypothetical protein
MTLDEWNVQEKVGPCFRVQSNPEPSEGFMISRVNESDFIVAEYLCTEYQILCIRFWAPEDGREPDIKADTRFECLGTGTWTATDSGNYSTSICEKEDVALKIKTIGLELSYLIGKNEP